MVLSSPEAVSAFLSPNSSFFQVPFVSSILPSDFFSVFVN
nr:MAG TPA: hypothetical protein [Bacteriophage sp.]